MQIEGGIYVYWFQNTGLDNCEQSYVGSTENFHKRHREHIKVLEKNKHMNNNFQHAYNKYGKENMHYEIVDKMVFPVDYSKQLKRDYLESRENYFYEMLKSSYNLCVPGFHTHSLKTKEQRTKSAPKTRPVYLVDKDLNILQRFNGVREAGRKLGINSTAITFVARLKRQSTSGHIFRYDETLGKPFIRVNIPSINKGKPREWNRRVILEYDLEGNFIKEYPSIKLAGLELGIRPSNISGVLRGSSRQTFGKFFKYKPIKTN